MTDSSVPVVFVLILGYSCVVFFYLRVVEGGFSVIWCRLANVGFVSIVRLFTLCACFCFFAIRSHQPIFIFPPTLVFSSLLGVCDCCFMILCIVYSIRVWWLVLLVRVCSMFYVMSNFLVSWLC